MAEQAGYFTDESMLRRINRERALVISGPRALLMQAAHPLAVEGLLAHTDSLGEPYERLERVGCGAERDRVRREGRSRPDVQARPRDARPGRRRADPGRRPLQGGYPLPRRRPRAAALGPVHADRLGAGRSTASTWARWRARTRPATGRTTRWSASCSGSSAPRCRTRSTTSTTTATRCSTATASS